MTATSSATAIFFPTLPTNIQLYNTFFFLTVKFSFFFSFYLPRFKWPTRTCSGQQNKLHGVALKQQSQCSKKGKHSRNMQKALGIHITCSVSSCPTQRHTCQEHAPQQKDGTAFRQLSSPFPTAFRMPHGIASQQQRHHRHILQIKYERRLVETRTQKKKEGQIQKHSNVNNHLEL